MAWKVSFSKKAAKQALDLDPKMRSVLNLLVLDLSVSGPVRGDWPNYSKLSGGRHHCHLKYAVVAVWSCPSLSLEIIEVTYVGSRKDAPY